MKGKILTYDAASQKGLISGDDNQRYTFSIGDWKSAEGIKEGRKVDFQTAGDIAKDILCEKNTEAGSKRIIAAILAFFLGGFGAHKFYLGKTGAGVIMLLVFLFGIILAGIPSMVIGIIAFIEFIIYLIKSDEEFDRLYIEGDKAWF